MRKLSGRDGRRFTEANASRLSELLPGVDLSTLSAKRGVWRILVDGHEFHLIGRKILVASSAEGLIPVILKGFNEEIYELLPYVVVDRGAVPHISNGADVMRPGVVRVGRSFKRGDIVVVKDETYGVVLAVGEALLEAEAFEEAKKGKVIRNIHRAGDRLWEAASSVEGSLP